MRALAVFMIVSSLLAPGLAAVAESRSRAASAEAHRDCGGAGQSSNHEEPAGDDCPQGCDCYCCPGHVKLLLGPMVSPAGALPDPTRTDPIAIEHLNPRLHVPRIFHPPRA